MLIPPYFSHLPARASVVVIQRALGRFAISLASGILLSDRQRGHSKLLQVGIPGSWGELRKLKELDFSESGEGFGNEGLVSGASAQHI